MFVMVSVVLYMFIHNIILKFTTYMYISIIINDSSLAININIILVK